jgi:hypothetical protein|tara:strand:- start:2261 stop:2953 length:693 start_codon:yes stop_codon:yes gene_type:complete
MGATYSGITSVTAGSVATVGNLNQYKEVLEGSRDFVPMLWATDNNNIVMRIGDAAGVNFFDIQDSGGVSKFRVDSDGNITSTEALTSTRLVQVSSDAVSSTTVLSDVVGMSFSIGASEVWTFHAFIMYDADTTPDAKLGWTGPSGCAATWSHTGDPTWNASGSTTINTPILIGGAWALAGQGAGTVNATTFDGTIVNGVTAGTFQLQYAANAAGTSTLKAQTHIVFTKVG